MTRLIKPANPAQVQYIAVPKTPVDELDRRCDRCVKWDFENRKDVAMTTQGQVLVAALLDQGLGIPPPESRCTVAYCTNEPNWNFVTNDHWCWQFLHTTHPRADVIKSALEDLGTNGLN